MTYKEATDEFLKVSTTANPNEAEYREACAKAAEKCSHLAIQIPEIEHWQKVADAFRDPQCDAPTQVQ